ncbi:bifunctional homocysteine S-methyltransferase/methylenetetrahydrofolate reductase, partial [bacterium]
MAKQTFQTLLSSGAPILADGAMGTMLHLKGIGFDQCFDELNLVNPALVAEIHRDYINAGAQIIQTNTFGANRYKLTQHGLEEKVVEINRAAVD